MKRLPILIIVLFSALLINCSNPAGQLEYREIKKIPEFDERLRQFSSYPVEEQIDTYLYSQYYVEGGSDEFRRFMASDGEEKISSILTRIDTDRDPDPRARVGLIDALDLIDQNCHCLAHTDGALDVLSRNEMKIDDTDSGGIKGFKELYKEILERIKSRAAEPGTKIPSSGARF